MELDGRHLHRPDHLGELGHAQLVGVLSVSGEMQTHGAEPWWRTRRHPLLVHLLATDAGRESVQHARPFAQCVDDAGAHAEVVVDQVELRLAARREVDPVRVGDAHDALANLDLDCGRLRSCHAATVPPDVTIVVVMSTEESREEVTLTNLDQPLFEGADATKRDLVDYLDARSRAHHPGARRPPAVGDPGPPRPGGVHAEERSEVHARLGAHRAPVGRDVEARGVVRVVQRPPNPAVVRQPARGGVPPDSGARRSARPVQPIWCSTSIRPSPVASPMAVQAAHLVRQALADVGLEGAVKTSGAKGVHVYVPIDDGVSMEDSAAATRAIAARVEQLDPGIATTAFIKEDRDGKVFIDCDARRRRDGGCGLQPAGPTRRARVVPRVVGRPRQHLATRLHHPHGRCSTSATAIRGQRTCPHRKHSALT